MLELNILQFKENILGKWDKKSHF